MTAPLTQHQVEIQSNLAAWKKKLLLQKLYAQFYQRIIALIDPQADRLLMLDIGGGSTEIIPLRIVGAKATFRKMRKEDLAKLYSNE